MRYDVPDGTALLLPASIMASLVNLHGRHKRTVDSGRRKENISHCMFLWRSCAPTLDDAPSERTGYASSSSLPPLVSWANYNSHARAARQKRHSPVAPVFASLWCGIAFMRSCISSRVVVFCLAAATCLPCEHITEYYSVQVLRTRSPARTQQLKFTLVASIPSQKPTWVHKPTTPTCCSIPNQKGSATTTGF
jgi:hypothetical protein